MNFSKVEIEFCELSPQTSTPSKTNSYNVSSISHDTHNTISTQLCAAAAVSLPLCLHTRRSLTFHRGTSKQNKIPQLRNVNYFNDTKPLKCITFTEAVKRGDTLRILDLLLV